MNSLLNRNLMINKFSNKNNKNMKNILNSKLKIDNKNNLLN